MNVVILRTKINGTDAVMLKFSFLMDKLGQYYNREKIYKTDNENFYGNAYFSLLEMIDITDKTTKNCQNKHFTGKSLDHYPKFVSDCVIESLKSKLR